MDICQKKRVCLANLHCSPCGEGNKTKEKTLHLEETVDGEMRATLAVNSTESWRGDEEQRMRSGIQRSGKITSSTTHKDLFHFQTCALLLQRSDITWGHLSEFTLLPLEPQKKLTQTCSCSSQTRKNSNNYPAFSPAKSKEWCFKHYPASCLLLS